jgi:hypothetical protein
MSNKITENYFDQPNFAEREKEVLGQIVKETGFVPEKEIFRGKIYDSKKVGSLIYAGSYENNPAVLKIQGLRPEVDEIDIMAKFNAQNRSKMVRLPRLYKGKKWNEDDEYGYLLQEEISGKKIYEPPFASPEEIQKFIDFYQEYKTNCVREPFFEKTADEQSSLSFMTRRVAKWRDIAESRGHLTDKLREMVEKFLQIAQDNLPAIPMEFMHGHLTFNDITTTKEGDYVLMSNLFWSYRPKHYDKTFHLWAGINRVQDISVDDEKIDSYIKSWVDAYKRDSDAKHDPDFERTFIMNMLERCAGSLLVDLPNQTNTEKIHIDHISGLFSNLFDRLASKLER